MHSSIDRMDVVIEVSGEGMPLLGGIEQHRTTSVSTPEGTETKRSDDPPFIYLDVLRDEKCHEALLRRIEESAAADGSFDPPQHPLAQP